MATSDSQRGAQESHEVVTDRTRAWWTTVLAGQVEQAHPVFGTHISAKVEDGVLEVTGTVPSAADEQEVRHEVERLRGKGVRDIRIELSVEPESSDEKGLLVQQLVAMFESDEQAGFARGYLESHAHVDPGSMTVIGGEAGQARRLLPEPYWEDAQRALEAGRSLLVVTVDETEAFRARELLDEETSSLETIVLPPEPRGKQPLADFSTPPQRATAQGASQ